MAAEHSLRYPTAVVAIALGAATFCASSAAATLPEAVTSVVKSTVPAAVAALPAASPPDAAPPSTPPATTPSPLASPPAAPATPRVPSSPLRTTPAAETTRVVVAAVTSATGKATELAAPPTRDTPTPVHLNDDGAGNPPAAVAKTADRARSAAAAGGAPAKPAPGGAPRSIGTAQAAQPRWWLARVWPAVALRGGEGPTQPTWWGGGGSPPAPRLAHRAPADSQPGSTGPPPPTRVAAPGGTTRPTPTGIPVPASRELTLFVIFSFAALLALLASTIWTELRARYR
jgi:hypothetical protein